MEKFVKIRSSKNYFIHTDGYAFFIRGKKDIKCKAFRPPNSKDVYVNIDGREMNLLYLMIEYFNLKLDPTQNIKFHITEELHIPLYSIHIRKVVDNISEKEYSTMLAFKCKEKAAGANNRCELKITPYQILSVLKVNEFKCIYCSRNLDGRTWHLDHYYPISKGGTNVIANLVPACKTCNLMKSNMIGEQFYKRCLLVVRNFKYKETLHDLNMEVEA